MKAKRKDKSKAANETEAATCRDLALSPSNGACLIIIVIHCWLITTHITGCSTAATSKARHSSTTAFYLFNHQFFWRQISIFHPPTPPTESCSFQLSDWPTGLGMIYIQYTHTSIYIYCSKARAQPTLPPVLLCDLLEPCQKLSHKKKKLCFDPLILCDFLWCPDKKMLATCCGPGVTPADVLLQLEPWRQALHFHRAASNWPVPLLSSSKWIISPANQITPPCVVVR